MQDISWHITLFTDVRDNNCFCHALLVFKFRDHMNNIFSEELVKAITGIQSRWALTAFFLLILLYLVPNIGKIPGRLKLVAILIPSFMLVVCLYTLTLDTLEQNKKADVNAIYSLLITLEAPSGVDLSKEKIDVTPDLDGTLKRTPSGWQFDIPASRVPADKVVTVRASVPDLFLEGKKAHSLTGEALQKCTVPLTRLYGGKFAGNVVEVGSGDSVAGARISILDTSETIKTDENGVFSIPLSKKEGQMIEVHVQADGYQSFEGSFICEPGTTIRLEKRK